MPKRVAIIGAGFGGTMTAVQLAKRGIDVTLIGRAPQVGMGVAYSTEDPAHLLNIPAVKMGAWPDAPGDFADATGADPEAYVPRMLFGRYLRDILEASAVTVIEGEAIGIEPGWTVRLGDGSRIAAEAVVLAPGNQSPDALPFARDLPEHLFAADPWGQAGRAVIAKAVASGGDVLVVGSGLSMIDVAMSLDAAGYCGKLVAVSRRGQMPRIQLETMSQVPSSDDAPSGSLRALSRWVRQRSGAIEWRDVVDSVRPRTHELWASLSLDDQRRFMRHARPWWDVHRHRIAPKAGAIVERMMAEGRMEVLGGRVQSLVEADGAIDAIIRQRGAAKNDPVRRFAVGINCTGPLHAIARTRDPVLRSLLDAGLAEPDALGIGINVDDGVRVIGADRMWAMGSLGKARYWEIIAVPDIRVQAVEVANAIAMELNDVVQP
ncbi:FAD-dependent oxidoreductase [Sphingomonas sp.]|uniref:FAD/NAD(P)-binding protein n=1 Tax=Sphingomonas sp. TaxID=28214 RepID=UPI00286A50A6|nr:FAD-dependent oxidoreductase [Sphingomonas sp.]